jgi:CubicO group peptidase (beta-lactamase class C family)
MRRFLPGLFLVLAAAALSGALNVLGRAGPPPAPPFDWPKAAPETQGLSGPKLETLREALAARRTKALLIIRNDRIVLEWYAAGHGPRQTHYTASLVKAIVGALLLLLGLDDGRFDLDEPVAKYVPQWADDPARARITFRQLATHSSGLADAAQNRPGWEEDFWKRRPDPFTVARDKAPLAAAPGKRFLYSNPGMAMLAYAVTAAYRGASGTDHRTLLKKRVMDPVGVPPAEWSVGYGQTYRVNGLDLVANWGGGAYTARAVARVGRLVLRGGDWQGKRLLSARGVERMLAPAGTPPPDRPPGDPHPASGLGWWLNADGVWPRVPSDAFAGAGAGHQILLVVPSQKLIVVRMGGALNHPSEKETFWGAAEKHFLSPLMEALGVPGGQKAGLAPYPPSPVIAGVRWAPKESIVRKARGSDNWPITWGADDSLYTAYGDGNGFEPFVPKKLGLGIARVSGSPPDFRGSNLRAPTAENERYGASGPKASGMLSVGGVLYLWVRNVGNSRLGWSGDQGRTWAWADWKLTSGFGCPTFLNFGRDYAGARDGFAYVYSPDGDSAYAPADRMVLARVPTARLRDRAAYEFFVRLDGHGRPVWSKDVGERGAVFTHPGRCFRSGISYNAGLKRYLWCQILPESRDPRGPRFQGGLGVYDAPEPWGPWTTAYFTNAWDVGPGETASFPTKWMTADGTAAHLVFSGDDCFSVRRATFLVRGN